MGTFSYSQYAIVNFTNLLNNLIKRLKSLYPEIPIEKYFNSLDQDKSIGDSSALEPILFDFFSVPVEDVFYHLNIHPSTILLTAFHTSIYEIHTSNTILKRREIIVIPRKLFTVNLF